MYIVLWRECMSELYQCMSDLLCTGLHHFSGISGNLEMSGDSARVGGKAQSRGICVVREIWGSTKCWWPNCGVNCAWTLMCMDTLPGRHITYLYFIRTVIHFSYAMFTENLDKEMCICVTCCLQFRLKKSGILCFFLECDNPVCGSLFEIMMLWETQ